MAYPEKILVNGNSYNVKYVVSKKFSSTVRIKNSELVIRLSKFLLPWDKENTVEKFLDWGRKQFEKFKNVDFVNPVYEDGARVCTHNRVYEICVHVEERSRIRVVLSEEGVIDLYFPRGILKVDFDKKVRDLVEKKIIEDQTPYLFSVISELNDLYFAEEFNELRFKRVFSRFGSCSSKRNINIAYRLLFAPREVFRYVCVHELSHLVEFNHSRRFWALVEAAVFDYKVHEKWLRENGFMLG